jgi:glycosyltransferase involved in cell wall biosynthesis
MENSTMSIRPAIVIAAYNRPHSLSRLLSMVLTAEYPDAGGVSLVISIDGGGADEVIRIANEFEWLFGDKEVIAHSKNLGLREHILCCGDLSQKYGAIIMLEDDIVVSPAFYQYASELGGFYYDDAQVAQVSLYAYEYGELSLERFHPLNIGYDVFFMQWASSWGQLWTDRQWHAFREWYVGHSGDLVKKPKLPEYVRGWPASSWKNTILHICVILIDILSIRIAHMRRLMVILVKMLKPEHCQ